MPLSEDGVETLKVKEREIKINVLGKIMMQEGQKEREKKKSQTLKTKKNRWQGKARVAEEEASLHLASLRLAATGKTPTDSPETEEQIVSLFPCENCLVSWPSSLFSCIVAVITVFLYRGRDHCILVSWP